MREEFLDSTSNNGLTEKGSIGIDKNEKVNNQNGKELN